MKKLLLLACSMLAAVGVYAQGTVNFANGAAGVNAPISYNTGSSTVLAAPGNIPGNAWNALLFAGPAGTAASQLSSSIVSGSAATVGSTSAGFVFGNARTISGIPSGSQAVLQIRVWSTQLYGASYPTSATLDGNTAGFGFSAPITVTLGGGASPTPNMVGLTPFTIAPVPEPSSIALGLLGLGAVALFRRRK